MCCSIKGKLCATYRYLDQTLRQTYMQQQWRVTYLQQEKRQDEEIFKKFN
jgi:Tfp pilus assembly protein PilO